MSAFVHVFVLLLARARVYACTRTHAHPGVSSVGATRTRARACERNKKDGTRLYNTRRRWKRIGIRWHLRFAPEQCLFSHVATDAAISAVLIHNPSCFAKRRDRRSMTPTCFALSSHLSLPLWRRQIIDGDGASMFNEERASNRLNSFRDARRQHWGASVNRWWFNRLMCFTSASRHVVD